MAVRMVGGTFAPGRAPRTKVCTRGRHFASEPSARALDPRPDPVLSELMLPFARRHPLVLGLGLAGFLFAFPSRGVRAGADAAPPAPAPPAAAPAAKVPVRPLVIQRRAHPRCSRARPTGASTSSTSRCRPRTTRSPPGAIPCIYICDGYWDFGLLKGFYGNLVYDKALPELIIVGIGYPGEKPNYDVLRRHDYTPVPDPTDRAGS